MADVTISSLPLGTPSGSALLPYSDGSTTYSARPSAFVAASSGSVLQVQITKVSTVVGPYTNSDGEFLRVSITPKRASSSIILETFFNWSGNNPNGYQKLQYSNDQVNWTDIDSGAINYIDEPIDINNTFKESYKTIVPAQGTFTHYYRVYWIHAGKNGGTMYMNRPYSGLPPVIPTSTLLATEIAG